jgi:predicted glycosyltransferase
MKKIERIWIDMDNSPHVPVFKPLINVFRAHGIEVIVTARDYAQTIPLLQYWNIDHTQIGKHGGKNKIKKIANLVHRSLQLFRLMRKKNIDLAISHGSRSMVVAAKLLSIKTVTMLDYEYTETGIFNFFSDYLLIPSLIPSERLAKAGLNLKKIIRYNGFKEELYLNDLVPDESLREKLGIPAQHILVTLRPSALLGNYHNPLSEKIILALLHKLIETDSVTILIVSRSKEDKQMIRQEFGEKIRFLEQAIDGLQLIWNSDVFISGGGTMNRESALLGVPTYSVFTGRKPYLDEHLEKEGKLVFINTISDIDKIEVKKRTVSFPVKEKSSALANEIFDTVTSLRN